MSPVADRSQDGTGDQRPQARKHDSAEGCDAKGQTGAGLAVFIMASTLRGIIAELHNGSDDTAYRQLCTLYSPHFEGFGSPA